MHTHVNAFQSQVAETNRRHIGLSNLKVNGHSEKMSNFKVLLYKSMLVNPKTHITGGVITFEQNSFGSDNEIPNWIMQFV